MAKNKKSPDIVKDSEILRTTLLKRFEALKLTQTTIFADARKRNRKFTLASLNKYWNHGNVDNSLTHEDLIWLAVRYGIIVKLQVGEAVFVRDGDKVKLKYQEVPYDEQKCLDNLHKYFPQ